MSVMGNQMGLRERRRRQTSADIRDAAVRLASDRGFDKVTIEAICAEAGISTRTFFNYFPTKESAIAYGPSDLPAELAEDFIAAGPAPYRVVLADDEIPALIAALALTAVRSGIERWANDEPKDADDTPMPYVERAATLV